MSLNLLDNLQRVSWPALLDIHSSSRNCTPWVLWVVGDVQDYAFRDTVAKGSWMEALCVLHRPLAVVSLDQFLET